MLTSCLVSESYSFSNSTDNNSTIPQVCREACILHTVEMIYKTTLYPPLFIEIYVAIPGKLAVMYLCARVSILPLSMIL